MAGRRFINSLALYSRFKRNFWDSLQNKTTQVHEIIQNLAEVQILHVDDVFRSETIDLSSFIS